MMYAEKEIHGEEVVGMPGQALSLTELRVLVGMADGENPNTISAAIGADKNDLRYIESNIKAKLGAKTQPHMIARGFTLGVLMPRALCLALALLAATEHTDDANRTRRGGRTAPSNRVARDTSSRKTHSGPGAEELGQAAIAVLSLFQLHPQFSAGVIS